MERYFMQYGSLPDINKPISRIVQGTIMISSAQREYSFDLLDSIYALGCNTFDMAHGYGSGDVERTFGAWMNERGLRDKIVILTKGAHPNADRKRVYPFDISSDLFDSLARLKTDYIDLYVLHRDDPTVPVEQIVDVLNEHKQAGRIHAFGGSNWNYERIAEANAYAAKHGLTPFVVSSPQFSLAEMMYEPWAGCISISGPSGEAARAWYAERDMALFTWSSLAGGFFSGRFNRDNLDSFTEYLDKLCVTSYCYEDNFKRLDHAIELAKAKGVTLAQIALAYIFNQGLNVFALVGCRSQEEFAANVAALDIKLTPEEVAWLDLRAPASM
jgi:aryl-alcohol dehydrogenase-like predicted oxidoreductase